MAVDNKASIFNIYKEYSIQFRQFFFLSFFLVQAVFFLICSRPQLIILVWGQIRENVLKNEYAKHVGYKQFVIFYQN